MHRIGKGTVRAFKTLAGLEQDKPAASWVFALYGFLFLLGMMLVVLWASGGIA